GGAGEADRDPPWRDGEVVGRGARRAQVAHGATDGAPLEREARDAVSDDERRAVPKADLRERRRRGRRGGDGRPRRSDPRPGQRPRREIHEEREPAEKHRDRDARPDDRAGGDEEEAMVEAEGDER